MSRLDEITQVMSGFNREMGFRLVDWSAECARTEVAIQPQHLNSQGIVHGGLYCAFLDFNCGIAGNYHDEDEPAKSCITLSLTTNFVSSARGGKLLGIGRKIGGGRKIFYAEAEIRDEAGTPLATAMGTFKYSHQR